MTYYTGCIAAVPTADRQAYLDHVKLAWSIMKKYGATRMVETWGVDTPKGKVTDFQGAVAAKDEETIVFSWIEWPDRATADAAWPQMASDPEMANMQMPFDGSRMIFGGFEPLMAEGQVKGAPYYQGFLLAVPEKNRGAYEKMAMAAWDMFKGYGSLGLAENWGVDVPEARRPTCTAPPRPKRARPCCSVGPPGPTAKPATRPAARWRPIWATAQWMKCPSTANACSGAGSRRSLIPATPEALLRIKTG